LPEDLKKLETLSYKPEHAAIVNRYGKKRSRVKQPSSAPLTPMGFNSVVIKPEIRANKGKVAEEQSECKTCGGKGRTVKNFSDGYGFIPVHKDIEGAVTCPDCPPEQPNQNLMIIEEIEGLISQANEKMYDLPVNPVRSQAIEEIDILLRITIKKQLREAFE
jgi:hypothetical protein